MVRHCHERDGSSDDEFPNPRSLAGRSTGESQTRLNTQSTPPKKEPRPISQSGPKTSTLRRRKLGQSTDDMLLRSLGGQGPTPTGSSLGDLEKSNKKCRSKGYLRAIRQEPSIRAVAAAAESPEDSPEEEEITFVEEASVDNSSEFQERLTSDSEDEEEVSLGEIFSASPKRAPRIRNRKLASPPPKSRQPPPGAFSSSPSKKQAESLNSAPPSCAKRDGNLPSSIREGQRETAVGGILRSTATRTPVDDYLPSALSKLRLDEPVVPGTARKNDGTKRPATPPSIKPPKSRAESLVSPQKLSRIPTTPHRPSTDTFWSQEFVDDWNDQHSPKKQLFPDTTKGPFQANPRKADRQRQAGAKPTSAREIKKLFEKSKHELAEKFLKELDSVITRGKLAEMAESTGGIKINWSNKLNTTAGRANWKRETLRKRSASGGEETVRYRHHASVELAEKVIDNEHRLLNVIAHEFCHLANFMISGVTGNPHGKEFKVWAAQCCRAFGHRGIEVTTKHSYDIDFKYIWKCGDCHAEFKRHSKSIDPERQRCGTCKGLLTQTKPVPRTAAKANEYQKFMKEHMKLLKDENPKSPQKEIMKLVADKWSRHQTLKTRVGNAHKGSDPVADVAIGLKGLAIEDGK